MDPSHLSPTARQVFKLIEFDNDEQLVCEIRKHWFGLFVIYFTGTVISAILGALALAVVSLNGDTSTQFLGTDITALQLPIAMIILLLVLLSTIFTAIAAYLYRSNVIIVTSEKLAQVLNPSLFSRKISQLSIGDIQDITVVQRGIIPTMLGYGTLVIETAGEQQNYTFTYAPEPYKCAQEIVGSHERNLVKYGN